MSITSPKDGSRVEVITSVKRRRRFSTEEKLLMVEESEQHGMTVSDVLPVNQTSDNRKFGL